MSKEELIQQYKELNSKIFALESDRRKVLKELEKLDTHRVGEIIVVKRKKLKREGDMFNMKFVVDKEYEVRGVCLGINPKFDYKGELYYQYWFKQLKKDGTIGQNDIHVGDDEVIWTGEIHEKYKDRYNVPENLDA